MPAAAERAVEDPLSGARLLTIAEEEPAHLADHHRRVVRGVEAGIGHARKIPG